MLDRDDENDFFKIGLYGGLIGSWLNLTSLIQGIGALATISGIVAGGFVGIIGGALLGAGIGAVIGRLVGRLTEKKAKKPGKKATQERRQRIERKAKDGSTIGMSLGFGIGMILGTTAGVIVLHKLETPTAPEKPKTETAWNISVNDNFNAHAMKADKTLVLDAKAFTRLAAAPKA